MSASAIAGGAVAIGNLASQLFTNNSNVAFQERINAYNRKMAWDMWNAENRYNHPAAQMQRLKVAGLNPALMYQDGSAGMPSATMNSPEQTAPQYRPVQLDPLTMANIDLANSQAEKNRADAEEAKSRVPIHQQQVLNMQQEINESIGRIWKMEQDMNESSKRVDLMDTEWHLKQIELFYSDQKHNAELDKIYSDILRNDVTNWQSYHQVRQAFEALMISSYEAQTGRMNAITNKALADAKISLTENEIKQYMVEWEALGVSFDSNGNIVLDPKGALAVEKGERKRHFLLYQYVKDYFGVGGQLLGGSASMVFTKKLKG